MLDNEILSVPELGELISVSDVEELKGMFERPTEQVSIDDMNAAIATRGVRKK